MIDTKARCKLVFPARLDSLLRFTKLDRAEFVRRVGLNLDTFINYQRGNSIADRDTIIRIVQVFDPRGEHGLFHWLVGLTDQPPKFISTMS